MQKNYKNDTGNRLFVSILWNEFGDSAPQRYSFETKIELNAFLEGVEAANDWMPEFPPDYGFRVHSMGEKQKFTPEDFDLDLENMSEDLKKDWALYMEDKGNRCVHCGEDKDGKNKSTAWYNSGIKKDYDYLEDKDANV